MRLAVVGLTLFTVIPTAIPTLAADICQAVALRDVAAVEDPDSILKRGEYDGAITQYRIDRATGMKSFCSHGGYCYPADALRLTNCKIGSKPEWQDEQDVGYGVDVVRSKNSAALLRYNDLDDRLLETGLCSACASEAAQEFIKRPHSKCGRTVQAALEGNPNAVEALNGGDICH